MAPAAPPVPAGAATPPSPPVPLPPPVPPVSSTVPPVPSGRRTAARFSPPPQAARRQARVKTRRARRGEIIVGGYWPDHALLVWNSFLVAPLAETGGSCMARTG